MDWLISAQGQDVRRARVLEGLSEGHLRVVVAAADRLVVAGLCGDPQRAELDALLWHLRNVGLADS